MVVLVLVLVLNLVPVVTVVPVAVVLALVVLTCSTIQYYSNVAIISSNLQIICISSNGILEF